MATALPGRCHFHDRGPSSVDTTANGPRSWKGCRSLLEQGGYPRQVGGSVKVVGPAGVAALDAGDQLGPGAQECPGADISARRGASFVPVLPGQEHRVARPTVVTGDGHDGAGLEGGDQPPYRLRPHQRLVG